MYKIRWLISLMLCLCMLVGVSACNSSSPIVVDPSHRSFFADGWGTSLAWWANEVGGWPADAQSKIITMLFAPPPAGLGLTIARYNIGAGTTADPQITASSQVFCPALRLGAQVPTFEPQKGVWNPMADGNQVQVLQAAKRAGANIFEAFVNSPPAWLTVSGCTSGNPKGDHLNFNRDNISLYVAYLQQVVAQFAAQGISFRTLEPFNEANPNDGGFVWQCVNNGHPCQEGANFSPDLEDSVLNALCGALQGTTTTVSAPDENSIDTTLKTYQQYKPLPQCLTQINTHSYKGSQRHELQTMALQQQKRLWMSEYTTDDPLTLAKQIATDLNGMHPAAWIYWQAVESFEQGGGHGLLHVPFCSPNSDSTIESLNQSFQEDSRSICQQMSPPSQAGGACNAQTAYCVAPTEQYSVMANYSMFVRPGDYLLDSPDPAHLLEAFNPSTHTLVLVETNDQGSSQPLTFDLSHFTRVTGPVQVYTTSRDKQVYQKNWSSTTEMSNQQLSTSLEANSVTTFVINGAYVGTPTSTAAAGPANAYMQAVLNNHPSAYYRLDETSGTIAHDSSGAGYDATYTGSLYKLGQPGIFGSSGDAAVQLNGDSGYVSTMNQATPLAATQGNHDRTVELWFQTSQTEGNLFTTGASSHTQSFDIALVGAGGPGGCGSHTSAGLYVHFWDDDLHLPGLQLADSQWHYIAVTVSRGGTMVTVVVDGQQPAGYVWDGSCYKSNPQAQPFLMPFPVNTASTPIGIGNSGWRTGINGVVDEVAIYPSALSVSELSAHYRLGRTQR